MNILIVPLETLTRWLSTVERGVWNIDKSVYGDVYVTRDVNPRILVRSNGKVREARSNGH